MKPKSKSTKKAPRRSQQRVVLLAWAVSGWAPGEGPYQLTTATAKEPISARVAAEIFVECDENNGEGEYEAWVWPPGEPEKAQCFIVTATATWRYTARKQNTEL